MTAEAVNRMVEAIAWWRVRLPDARAILEQAAVDLLVEGDDHPTVAEMAGMYPDESAFFVDALVERIVEELDLHVPLALDQEIVAARRICRSVISGELSPRELTSWAHQQFHHESKVDLINELAVLDDDYDEIEWSSATLDSLDLRVREVAVQFLETQ